MTDDHLDGNVLAGPLSSVFTAEVTAAVAVCAGCGRSGPLAAARVYGAPMGYVARCPGCDQVLLRYAEAPAGTTLDMRGIATLRLTTVD
ncbi:DUF6510 family protein [Amycolatopsis sp. NPDC004169]|uniref:DUF6510 family protein n=1 Tax=Amycolatopsis sp. NPDC004169 TaxID=3154453 RepID=UPI00339F9631